MYRSRGTTRRGSLLGGRDLALATRKRRLQRRQKDLRERAWRHGITLVVAAAIAALGTSACLWAWAYRAHTSGGYLAVLMMGGVFTACGAGLLLSEVMGFLSTLSHLKNHEPIED